MTPSLHRAISWLIRHPNFLLESDDGRHRLYVDGHEFIHPTIEDAIEAAYEELQVRKAREEMVRSEG